MLKAALSANYNNVRLCCQPAVDKCCWRWSRLRWRGVTVAKVCLIFLLLPLTLISSLSHTQMHTHSWVKKKRFECPPPPSTFFLLIYLSPSLQLWLSTVVQDRQAQHLYCTPWRFFQTMLNAFCLNCFLDPARTKKKAEREEGAACERGK